MKSSNKKLGIFLFLFCMSLLMLSGVSATNHTTNDTTNDTSTNDTSTEDDFGTQEVQVSSGWQRHWSFNEESFFTYPSKSSTAESFSQSDYDMTVTLDDEEIFNRSTPGIINYSADFSNVDGYINVPTTFTCCQSITDPDGFAHNFWLKKDGSASQEEYLIEHTDSVGDLEYSILLNNNGELVVRSARNGVIENNSVVNVDVADNQWHNIYIEFSNSGSDGSVGNIGDVFVYVDDTLEQTINDFQVPSATEELRVGSNGKDTLSQGDRNYNGQLDELVFFGGGETLTTGEISDVYNNGEGVRAEYYSMSAYYSLEESSGSVAVDDYGLNNGTYNGNLPTQTTGQVGNAQDFTSSSDVIDSTGLLKSEISNAGAVTMSFWLNLDNTNNNRILGWNSGSTNYVLAQYQENNIRFYNGNDLDYSFTQTGSWHHFVMIDDGTNRYIYHNGNQVASDSQSGIGSDSENFKIGDVDGNGAIDGQIDEVSVYNTAFSEGFINRWYNSSSGIDYNNTVYGTQETSNPISEPTITQNVSNQEVKMFDAVDTLILDDYYDFNGSDHYFLMSYDDPITGGTESGNNDGSTYSVERPDDNNWVYDRNFTVQLGESTDDLAIISSRTPYNETETFSGTEKGQWCFAGIAQNSTDTNQGDEQCFNLTINAINFTETLSYGSTKTINLDNYFGQYATTTARSGTPYDYFGIDLRYVNGTNICIDVNTTSECQNADGNPNVSVDQSTNITTIKIPDNPNEDNYEVTFKTMWATVPAGEPSPIITQADTNYTLSGTVDNGDGDNGNGDGAFDNVLQTIVDFVIGLFPDSENVSAIEGFTYWLVFTILTSIVIFLIAGIQNNIGWIVSLVFGGIWFIFFTLIGFIPVGIVITILIIALLLIILLNRR